MLSRSRHAVCRRVLDKKFVRGGDGMVDAKALCGQVFDIQRFCLQDGPGIRTTVFLKGCPLHCRWCHNPESHSSVCDLLYDDISCISCGACISVCPSGAQSMGAGRHIVEHLRCIGCGACVAVCPTSSLQIAGRLYPVEDIIDIVERDRIYYRNSGGGLTISGGEPLLQYDFVYAILKDAVSRGLHTCLETSGYGGAKELLSLCDVTNLFLYDWKCTDDILHQHYTGVSNQRIESNLRELDDAGAKIILRCPIISGINDTDVHFQGIGRLVDSLQNIVRVEIEPYHDLGVGKYVRLGQEPEEHRFAIPSPSDVQAWIGRIQAETDVLVQGLS